MSAHEDEMGLCVHCGGHGFVMVRDSARRFGWGSERCGVCDGRDKVTPLIESQAEAMHDA